jgi:hypothetical protein
MKGMTARREAGYSDPNLPLYLAGRGGGIKGVGWPERRRLMSTIARLNSGWRPRHCRVQGGPGGTRWAQPSPHAPWGTSAQARARRTGTCDGVLHGPVCVPPYTHAHTL